MKTIKTISYSSYLSQVPQQGKHILAQQDEEQLIVYQAFNPKIASYAVQHQEFGGSHYSFNRMSWIKPNFLWMMYRCGWASKPNQERVLALWLKKTDFNLILLQAAHSSYKAEHYDSLESWKAELANKTVRLQWDPDHDPHGQKQERRAIQLGLKGDLLKQFCTRMVTQITDITPFVIEQHEQLKTNGIENLTVPQENIYLPDNKQIIDKIGISL